MDDVLLIYSDKKPPQGLKDILVGKGFGVVPLYYKNLSSSLDKRNFDAVLIDSGNNGEEWLLGAISMIRGVDENMPVVVVMSSNKIDEAVNVMKKGAYDCLTHPLDKTRLVSSIQNGIRLYKLAKKIYLLETELNRANNFDDIIGQSKLMQEVFQLIRLVSKSDATVLVLGESGTGKELVAKAIHRHSPQIGRASCRERV